jgi:hypothetical protein
MRWRALPAIRAGVTEDAEVGMRSGGSPERAVVNRYLRKPSRSIAAR